MKTRVRVCRNCYDYAGPSALLVRDADGVLVHDHDMVDDPERCAGQGDDDTDDRAEPMWLDHDDAVDFEVIEP